MYNSIDNYILTPFDPQKQYGTIGIVHYSKLKDIHIQLQNLYKYKLLLETYFPSKSPDRLLRLINNILSGLYQISVSCFVPYNYIQMTKTFQLSIQTIETSYNINFLLRVNDDRKKIEFDETLARKHIMMQYLSMLL